MTLSPLGCVLQKDLILNLLMLYMIHMLKISRICSPKFELFGIYGFVLILCIQDQSMRLKYIKMLFDFCKLKICIFTIL